MLVTRAPIAHLAAHRSRRPTALTIGNFDGVHRGHQAMVGLVIEAARSRGLDACVLTFEPHPREVFSPESAPSRLTNLRTKLELLESLGVDRVHVQHFTRGFAALSPEAFVERLLHRTLAVRWVLVGDDFRFGARRAGDVEALRRLAPRYGFEVAAMPTIADNGTRISSSAVRAALVAGDLAHAERLLGRVYGISGRVVHGAKLGRQLGFATANVQLKHNHPPLFGIYAVRVRGYRARTLDGVASLGFRPTVTTERKATLEVHLFDFNADLYGAHLRVDFLHKIRDEEKYPDLERLKAAIANDCIVARRLLASTSPAATACRNG